MSRNSVLDGLRSNLFEFIQESMVTLAGFNVQLEYIIDNVFIDNK